MKKIYTFLKANALPSLLVAGLLASGTSFSQAPRVCGVVVQDFDNTAGSTAGFTGDFSLQTSGGDGYLAKDRVVPGAVYSITTPTYILPNNATSIGFGFVLDGTDRVARAEVKLLYVSSLNGELITVFLGQFVPSYNPGATSADFCRAVELSDLPGFPTGGKYRFRIELTPNTGTGAAGQTVTFDDFSTNGTFSQSPLPVNFIGFEAKKLNSSVLLTWKVAGEENVNRYEVERSEDGRTFTTIGSIDRHGKDTYTYTDATAGNTAYYRIRNVDNDNKFKYSNILRIVNGKSDIVIKAFPQPVVNQLTVQHPTITGSGFLTISSADGKVVRTLKLSTGSMQTSVDLSSLHSGLYMVRFDDGAGNTETFKVVKQ